MLVLVKFWLSAVNMSLSSVTQHEQIKGYCSTGDKWLCSEEDESWFSNYFKNKTYRHKPKGRISVHWGIYASFFFVEHPAQLESADPQSLSKVREQPHCQLPKGTSPCGHAALPCWFRHMCMSQLQMQHYHTTQQINPSHPNYAAQLRLFSGWCEDSPNSSPPRSQPCHQPSHHLKGLS